MIKIILGIDGATFSTGWSIIDMEGNLVKYGWLKSKDKNLFSRIYEISCQFTEILKENPEITIMVFESAHGGKGSKVLRMLSQLQGALLIIAMKYGLGIITYEPQQWRSCLGFKRKSKNNPYDGSARMYEKNQAIWLVNEKYDLGFEEYQDKPKSKHGHDDVADSISIILAYLEEIKDMK